MALNYATLPIYFCGICFSSSHQWGPLKDMHSSGDLVREGFTPMESCEVISTAGCSSVNESDATLALNSGDRIAR